MKEVTIFGLKITSGEIAELNEAIARLVQRGTPSFVLSANIHGFNLALRLPWLADFYNRADVVHIDGDGIILAAKILGAGIGPKITWADWAWRLARDFAERRSRLFLLGGPPGLAQAAAGRLMLHAPELLIGGVQHGYFKKVGPENDAVLKLINRAKPDILWVGMGMPLQERWILDNYRRLDVKVFMVCGAALTYMAGRVKRGPDWIIKAHSEWVWRLLQDPRGKVRRYLYGNPVFMLRVLKEKWNRPG
jgi:N-acetylglucosaminyldiphosphoundecaprenol N-acetyl-beta-D-mannosaminyltransferase